MWLLSIWNVASAIKELNFLIYLILVKFKYPLVPNVYHIVKLCVLVGMLCQMVNSLTEYRFILKILWLSNFFYCVLGRAITIPDLALKQHLFYFKKFFWIINVSLKVLLLGERNIMVDVYREDKLIIHFFTSLN